ncbi:MAG TPA: hypothetical protein VD969_17005 [Symbiobacteriaceae bacterium]|nr:hypothetical protein [Symbiobacteriaceae bacterium]
MRPSDRTIRDELRREAARVPVPEDMWQNISRQLELDSERKRRRPRVRWLSEWRPAVILGVAAGFFWFALIPSLPNTENMPDNTTQTAIVIPASKTEPTVTTARSTVKESDLDPPDKMSPAMGTSTGGAAYKTLPQ